MILKAVLDTNILISGMMWRGIPYELLGWAEKGALTIYTSLDILTEGSSRKQECEQQGCCPIFSAIERSFLLLLQKNTLTWQIVNP